MVPPIKLVEHYQSKDRKKKKSKKKPRVESESTSRSDDRETIPREDSRISKPSVQEDGDSEEETEVTEQEIEVAEKWLDHRKKKIAQVSKELKREREAKPKKKRITQEEPASNYSSKARLNTTKDTYDSRGSAMTQPSNANYSFMRKDDSSKNIRIEDENAKYQSNERYSHQISTQPGFHKRQGSFKEDGRETFGSTPTLKAASHTNSRTSFGPGLIDIEKMTPEEMIELKKILEERLKLENVNERLNEIQVSAQKKIAKIEALLTINQANIGAIEKDLEEAAVTIATNKFETEHKPETRHRRYPSRTLDTQSKLGDRTAADSELMRDFESINNTPYGSTLKSKSYFGESRARNIEGLDEIEREYQEKLQEFLKIRDKMIMSKKYKEFKFNPEDYFKGTSKVSLGNTKVTFEETKQRPTKITSSPLLASGIKDDTFSDKDLEYSMNSPLQSYNDLNRSSKQSKNGSRSQAKKINFAPDTEFHRKRKESESYKDHSKSNLSAEFYDDNLLNLVEDLEKRESGYGNTSKKAEANSQSQSRMKASSIEEEFNSLFNTVILYNTLIIR